jgi:5-methyltetrahydrofolate--homocysteine methyltransferase
MATALSEFVSDFGVRVVGGCCGTTPAHLREVVNAIRPLRKTPSRTNISTQPGQPTVVHRPARVSSAMRAITLHQDPPPLLVGERVNSQGSRKIKKLLLNDDYEGILAVARDQLDSGAHVLDVCVALTERADEAEQMSKVVKMLSMSVNVQFGLEQPLLDLVEGVTTDARQAQI